MFITIRCRFFVFRTLRLAVVCAAASLVGSCATVVNPVSGKKEISVMDESDEIANGRQQHDMILQEYGRLDNPALQAYVNEVVQKIARISHRPNLPWTVTVLDSPEVNAFATTGGYVYITRGIMAYLNSEEEMAGVLGHEMGHITARHVARQTRNQYAAQGLAILGVLAGAYFGGEQGAQLGGQLAGSAGQVFGILPHSREHEHQADDLGVEYLDKSGYDPRAMTRVIEVLKLQETFAENEARMGGTARLNRMPTWLATHPANEQRMQRTREAAALRPSRGPNSTDAGRERNLRAIDGVTFGDSREQGVSRGRNFYHEPLNFTVQRPNGWKFQNETAQLTIVADDRSAAVVIAPANPNGNHEQAIRNMLKPDQGRAERITINGNPATYFSGSLQGKPIEATVVNVSGTDFMMVPLAQTPQARQQRRADVLAILNSVRRMNVDDVRAAKPHVLRTTAMPRSAPGQGFRELARGAPELTNAEAQLRLMNRAYPTGDIEPGRMVKSLQ
jgi:predicted Zn-dependent protease